MIGKKIRINDYKFTYGKEVMYVPLVSVKGTMGRTRL